MIMSTAADVNTPLGAHDIYDEEDFIIALTKLIASHLDITRWVFKLESAWQVHTITCDMPIYCYDCDSMILL
jgi:hypothetical protein